jgi:hypothetical protein
MYPVKPYISLDKVTVALAMNYFEMWWLYFENIEVRMLR